MNIWQSFVEAHRRILMNKDDTDLKKIWVGLGNRTMYRQMLQAGYMKWVFGKPELRCDGWLVFTQKGIKRYQEMLPTLEKSYGKTIHSENFFPW